MLLFWSCMDQWLLFSTIHSKLEKSNASGSAARRCSEQRLDLTKRRCSRARFSGGASLLRRSRCGRWSGAVVQDNCETDARTQSKFHTHFCEPRAGVALRIRSRSAGSVKTISSYLVDPASSHMLVLKIKPCMSKYKHLYRETANGSLKQLWFI